MGTINAEPKVGCEWPLNGGQAAAVCCAVESQPTEPRNEIERELVLMWREVLQLNAIGITEDFIAAGGNSLLTIAKGGRVFDHAEGIWSTTRVVPIQPNGARPTLFLCMDGGPMYRGLAKYLGSDQPLVGITLEQADLDGIEVPHRLEDIAKLVARTIREAQPDGPYHLAGWCLGGVVAYETARQFELAGDRVALVAMFDSPNLGYYRNLSMAARSASFACKMAHHLDQLRHWDTAPRYIKQRIVEFGQKFVRLRLRFRGYRQRLGYAERIEPLVAGFLAAYAYSARPYGGRVVSFIPKERVSGRYWNYSTSWIEAASGLETREVPGSHTSMFEEPNVKALADCLTGCL